jgi:MFS family permease
VTHTATSVQRTYLGLLLANTLAASFIWGINTIFLLDAGLTNFEAFAANAFFTAGMVLFEVPTGVVADTRGRRISFLLGAATLLITTLLYLLLWQLRADFWWWAMVSLGLGLGFTFFSGALEAWLVDALKATHFQGGLEAVFAKGQVVSGAAMLVGSVAGGVVAQFTNLGVPYIIRAVVLGLSFMLAFMVMRDIGFTPDRTRKTVDTIKDILNHSIHIGFHRPSIRWLMWSAPLSMGLLGYVFYALQPYLLELYGDPRAYTIAGLVAAILAGSQIIGGLAAARIRRLFRRRTSAIIIGTTATGLILAAIGLVPNFWFVLAMIVLWGIIFAAMMPIQQAYLNSLIPSKQRATVLSMNSLMGSAGGVVSQPVLGRIADISGYANSYLAAAIVQLLAVPLLIRARRHAAKSDYIETESH